MAKATKKSSTKRAGAKARPGAAAKGRSGAKGAAKKRGGSRKSREQSGLPENLLGAMSTLVGSAGGRQIVADVLEAVASVLRKTREGVAQVAEQGSGAASSAAGVAGEVVSGTVDLAQTAAGVLADVATSAARSMMPGSMGGDGDNESGGAGRGRTKAGNKP
jgi:hypothetical protein